MRILVAPARGALLAGSCLLLLSAAACSGSNGGSGTSAGAGAGHTTSVTTSNSGSGSGGATCPGDLAQAPSSAFCQGDPATIDCGDVPQGVRDQVCGVAVQAPTTPLARSSTVMEFAGSGPPDLSCLEPADYPKAGTPMTVTISGVARIFSHGSQSNDLNIEVHTVKRTGGADDGIIGPIVGKAVLTDANCMTNGVAATSACGDIYECKYTYPGVPTETELVILTNGQLWAPLYEYNDYIPNAQVTNGVWSHDVRALANDDYSAIPQAAIGSGIMTGFGAIAGEVHDCGNVRLSGATVGTNVASEGGSVYFDNDEASPLPDTSASSTSILGLYAAFDIAPGPASVAALGLVGGKVTTVGYFPAYVYANSVTAVTFQGVWPFQIDAKP